MPLPMAAGVFGMVRIIAGAVAWGISEASCAKDRPAAIEMKQQDETSSAEAAAKASAIICGLTDNSMISAV